jgi:D-glycero-alpha-D-manno-heptose-7-phosphate kinase
MILTRTPLRICLGGGGTDVPDYYERFGGFVVSAAINQYIYITIHKHFEKNIRLCYSKREIITSTNEVRHPVVHEALRLFGISSGGFEIISFADVPAETGVGTSSSFTVGLITALAAYKRIMMTKHEIAEMACHIERTLLKEAGGKQDQYIAAFGGITSLIYDKDGTVRVNPVQLSYESVEALERNLLLFYTGIKRNSPKVQRALIRRVWKETETLESLHEIKRLGIETEEILRLGQVDRYADLLQTHWHNKKRLSDEITNGRINRLYELGMSEGALGGKIIGAGGGGYLLLYSSDAQRREKIRAAMQREGLEELKCRFDFTGAIVLVDDGVEKSELVTV